MPDCRHRPSSPPRKNLIIFQKRVASLSEPTLRRFSLRARRAVGLKGTVNLLLTSSAAMRSVNRQFRAKDTPTDVRSEEHTSELQSPDHLVCRLLLEKKKYTHSSYRACLPP